MVYDLCIIGGGQSGLVTLKTFLETTQNVILLEKCDGCIGLFSTIKEQDAFKWSTSRYMSGFSDFPMPKSVPVWFTIKDYVTYLESYKTHFGLTPYIHYNSAVQKCYQNDKEEWVIEYNTYTKIVCKKLIICTGLNQTPKFPEIVDQFTGELIHAHNVYTKMTKEDWANKFTGKRILLLGGGESAYDIGHVLTKYANTLYYSTQDYTEWFPKGNEEPEIYERVNNINNKCLTSLFNENSTKTPTDTQLNYLEYSLPEPMSHLFHEYFRNASALIGLTCTTQCTHQHDKLCSITKTPRNLFKKYVVKRTEFLIDIHDKKADIVYYPDSIKGTTIYTKEKQLDNIDIIVCATGYQKYFPFLQDNVWKGELIKKMIPVNYKNIAFIGYARPTMGSIAAVAEMQGWWIQRYFYDSSFSYSIRTPFFRTIDPLNLSNEHINTVVIGCFYLKDLAKDLQIEPQMIYLALTDFSLFYKIITGSCHPMMYRIHGYKTHSTAREILLDTYVSNEKKGIWEWVYLIFHFILHLLFIGFLILIAFVLSYSIYLKPFSNYLLYKNMYFIALSSVLVLFFYNYF
jgi:hypothetical protein